MSASDIADIVPYLLAVVTLVLASAYFSGTEVAMFSLRRVDREQMAESSRRSDSLVVRLLAKPRRLIATILIGNEVVNVSMSAVMAGIVGRVFAGRSELSLALLATGLALPLLLFFGEITPKTVAIKSSATWARAASRPLWLFDIVVTPVRAIVRGVADLLMRPFGGSTLGSVPKELGEEEFKALVDAGSAEGEVDARERRLIHKVFEFGDKTIAQVMTPRQRVFALSYELPLARLIQEAAARGYSRVPIYHKAFDNLRGILYARDLVGHATGLAQPRPLGELLHEPLFVPQTIQLERLFRIFKQRKTHMALVVNEYGKLAGLVTMEDLLEELFGEIRDERELQKAMGRALRLATERPADGGGRPAGLRNRAGGSR
jgi:putative hemolysin